MKALLLAILAASSMLVAAQANAVDAAAAQALYKGSGCMACHSVGSNQKGMGPDYKDVAAEYKGDKTAEARLIKKVKAGGGEGFWQKKNKAMMPSMPANGHVKDEDIKTLVQWILSL